MRVSLEKNFEVEQAVDIVWNYLINPVDLVECVPGVTLNEKVDEKTYKGTVGQKFGPISVTYNGEIVFEKIDEQAREISIKGKGIDSKGKGSVEMSLNMVLEKRDTGTSVKTTMNISVVGMIAQFGSRLISDVSDHLFKQFVENFKTKLSGKEIEEKDKEIKGGQVASTVAKSVASSIKGLFSKKDPEKGSDDG